MFSLFFKTNSKNKDKEDLEYVLNTLFPKSEIKQDNKGSEFYVDYSLDSNLEAALQDLENGINDEVVRKTIKEVSDKLYEIRQKMNVFNILDKNIDSIEISIKKK